MLLYKLMSPRYFLHYSKLWLPWFWLLTIAFISLGLVYSLAIAPPDYQQGDAYRILYIHVPCAMLSMSIYAFMGILSFLILVWRIKLAGVMLQALLPLGATMAMLALITGSIWGKPMWGTWWVWDARLTSELVLFFLYIGLYAVHKAYYKHNDMNKIVAILCIIGLIDLPIIHYSVYWWNTLHQGSTVFSGKNNLDKTMLLPLIYMSAGLISYNALVFLIRVRTVLLQGIK